jgi:deoxyribose-phosphate aldolase
VASDIKLPALTELINYNPTISGNEVDALVNKALDLGCMGVLVPPFWVKRAAREIGTKPLQLITIAGYALGHQMTEVKMEEARLAVRDGARELEVTLNYSAFSVGLPWTKIELVKLSKFLHDEGCIFKVLVDLRYLQEGQYPKLFRMIADAGADYVSLVHFSAERIKQIRKIVPSNVGIKGWFHSSYRGDQLDGELDRIGINV